MAKAHSQKVTVVAPDTCDEHLGMGLLLAWLCEVLTWGMFVYRSQLDWILYTGKLSRIGEKYDFRGENFHRLLAFAVPKDATPPNFVGKNFHE